MDEQNLCHLPLDEHLVAAVSQLLDSVGVANVLWGNYLLTVYGIPSLTNVWPKMLTLPAVDEQKPTCFQGRFVRNLECTVVKLRSRPPPTNHFHLETEAVHVCLYPQSQVLPNISDLQNAEEQGQIISASDASLPRWQMGHGKGAFAAEYSCVRVPSATCFVEASLLNFVRQARKKDYGSALDMHYLGCVTYMIEYAYPGGYLDLDILQPVFRTFLVDGFLNHNSSALFAAARGRLMASEIK
ncbi:hypothetical protein ACJ73_04153 [Blastomyces percursus]|uniref:Uncharacterized protein n=1 Tax=Blastomyces percursus TaxID=1658174 RepID=A0A1J9R9Z9_9EURO|nr:hypothetical protein ACJ73_04153 [Blastomyces percursus]